jgi:carbon monoxide dehydrogenase subunit G
VGVEITNAFSVAAPPDQVWPLLTDIERISPCVPGFQLQEIEGEEYRGIMRVKVGAITAEYKARISFVERDDAAQRAVLRVSGADTKGQGGVEATVSSELTPDGAASTLATMRADVNVSGRLGQFGRNVLTDVSRRLTQQFVTTLEERYLR